MTADGDVGYEHWVMNPGKPDSMSGTDALSSVTKILFLTVEVAREAGVHHRPLSFDIVRGGRDARTMMGVSPEEAAKFLEASRAHVAATNCETDVDVEWMTKILARYRTECSLPLMAKPNAASRCWRTAGGFTNRLPKTIVAGSKAAASPKP